MSDAHQPTVKLVECAYPEGIPDAEYMALLSILVEEMSFRVLATVIAHVKGGEYVMYLNEVYGCANKLYNEELLATIKGKLENCGYAEWLQND